MSDSIAARVGAWSRRQTARWLVRRSLEMHVTGLDAVPRDGPLILAARHYHHLYDALAILAMLPWTIHIMIALDWLGTGPSLQIMRALATAARWPGVWRPGETWRFNRQGYRLALELLHARRTLLVFPEGYPTIDPRTTARRAPFLPFDPGFLVLAERAAQTAGTVAVVPVGLWYGPRPAVGGWPVWLRFGEPLRVTRRLSRAQRRATLKTIAAEVQRLSQPPLENPARALA